MFDGIPKALDQIFSRVGAEMDLLAEPQLVSSKTGGTVSAMDLAEDATDSDELTLKSIGVTGVLPKGCVVTIGGNTSTLSKRVELGGRSGVTIPLTSTLSGSEDDAVSFSDGEAKTIHFVRTRKVERDIVGQAQIETIRCYISALAAEDLQDDDLVMVDGEKKKVLQQMRVDTPKEGAYYVVQLGS